MDNVNRYNFMRIQTIPNIMTKRFLSILFVALAFSAIANGQPAKGAADAEKRKFTIVCLGDSITAAGYPQELEKMLPVHVINAGIGGNTSRQGLARLERDVLRHKPDAVILFFGTNDSRRDAPKIHVPLEEYEKNLSEIVKRCQAIGAKVVLGTSPPIDTAAYYERHPETNYVAVGGLEPWITKYRATVLRVGKSKNVPVVDLNQLLAKESTWRKPDGVHPTEEGNQILARIFAKQIKPILPREP